MARLKVFGTLSGQDMLVNARERTKGAFYLGTWVCWMEQSEEGTEHDAGKTAKRQNQIDHWANLTYLESVEVIGLPQS